MLVAPTNQLIKKRCSILDQREYIYFIKLNLNMKEFQESNKYFYRYQVNKIEYFDELFFILKLHSNLNIKLDFQVNSLYSTSLC